MPFKSQAQRAWMYATHPRMAKRWSAHTSKGEKLPKRVGEKHVQTIDGTILDSPIHEMPHLESDFGPVDLRIERYPMPQAGKSRLMQDFQKTGLVGMRDGRWFHFAPDHTVKEIKPDQAADLPHLPDDWDEHAVVATGDRTPKMKDVFRGIAK